VNTYIKMKPTILCLFSDKNFIPSLLSDFCNMRLYLNFFILSLFWESISVDHILLLSALIPVVDRPIRETRFSLSMLENVNKEVDDPFKGTSFIDTDIKAIITKMSSEAPDMVFYFRSFVSQLEAARSASRAELNSVYRVKNKTLIDAQKTYTEKYKLEQNDLCPMIFVCLPTVLISLMGIKVDANWVYKRSFSMPELIIAILKGIKSPAIPRQARREVAHYLRKYTPEIREFLAMCVLYIEEYKTFGAHKTKLHGLANYFLPMCNDSWNQFTFNEDESKNTDFDDKAFCLVFYKVYVGLFHSGCLALIANIRAIFAENKVTTRGAVQTFFETAEILYPYVKQYSETTKIIPWEKADKKVFPERNKGGSTGKGKKKPRFDKPKAQDVSIEPNVVNEGNTSISTPIPLIGADSVSIPAPLVSSVEGVGVERTTDSISIPAPNVVEPTEEEQVTSCTIEPGTRPVLSSIVAAPAEAAIEVEVNHSILAKPTGKDSLPARPALEGKDKDLYLDNIIRKLNKKDVVDF
jgi:hypothetical protein